MSTEGKIITCRAAVAWAAGEKLRIENIQVDPPKAGEVRVKIVSTGIVSGKFCTYILSSSNFKKIFPISAIQICRQ